MVWDWNGTLFDDTWLCVDVMNGVLSRRGMPTLSEERYREIFDFPVRDYYVRLGFDFDQETFEVVGTEFIENYESRREEGRLKQNAVALLGAIRSSGAEQSVLSAYQQTTLDELIAHFGLSEYFVRLVGLQNHYAHSKLDNGVRWIEELSHEPHDVLMIGDTVHDYDVATAMGVDCILLAGGHQSEERLRRCPVPVVESLADLQTRIHGSDGLRP